MKIAIPFFFILSIVLVLLGFYFKRENYAQGELLIGLGVVCGFLISMPLFLYNRWKDRDVKEYMLTKESFQKMRDYEANREKEKEALRNNENKDA
jgi:4-amino-4-deoxy-L-arabinose transferase-like glycosyltransferase